MKRVFISIKQKTLVLGVPRVVVGKTTSNSEYFQAFTRLPAKRS